jgi:hypothetical protein
MSSRERLNETLNHRQPARVVVDFGSSLVTGISALALSKLRDALGLEKRPVKIYDPMQMLGLIEEDLREALKIDVVGVWPFYSTLGYKNENWKPWRFKDIDFLIGGGFEYDEDGSGALLAYPRGDRSVSPSMKMPAGGYYFDAIVRQGEVDEKNQNGREDFKNDFAPASADVISYMKQEITNVYENTDYGINIGNFIGGLGDVAALPGISQPVTNGIRNPEEWLVAHYTMPEYIHDVYSYQTDSAIQTLQNLKEATPDMPQVVQISGTDFGTQRSEFISPNMYREFYQPYHAKINSWVHENTNWKTMYHTCGSIVNLLDDFADAGMDILNPVQCSAKGMDPEMLKNKYGDKFVFWGGGVETQGVLQLGSAQEVKEEVTKRLKIFAPGGGFVFNTVHNIQPLTPVENILAMYEAIEEYRAKE